MKIGDRVVWLGALDKEGNPKGGWAGNGRGSIQGYEKQRLHFLGGPPTPPNEPTRGPAIGILLDNGDPNALKKHVVWVAPSSNEVIPDPLMKEEAAA